jgi:hypothetical protein
MTHKGFLRYLAFLRRGTPGAFLALALLLSFFAGTAASTGNDPVMAGAPGIVPLQNTCTSVLLEHRGKNHETIRDFLAPASRELDAPPPSRLRLAAWISAPLRHAPLASLILYTQTTASDL